MYTGVAKRIQALVLSIINDIVFGSDKERYKSLLDELKEMGIAWYMMKFSELLWIFIGAYYAGREELENLKMYN